MWSRIKNKLKENKLLTLVLFVNILVLSFGLAIVFGLQMLRVDRFTTENTEIPVSDLNVSVVFEANLLDSNYTLVSLLDRSLEPIEFETSPVYDAELNETRVMLAPGVYKLIILKDGASESDVSFQVLAHDSEVRVAIVNDDYPVSEILPTVIPVEPGSFVHPLLGCSGFSFTRGYSSYHRGVDMAKEDGCWINSIGNGEVITAGWGANGAGFQVIIDHGNGILSKYYHGSGEFKVKVGDQVKAGQQIMYMGSTGNSNGTHLHLEMLINEVRIDPEDYVVLRNNEEEMNVQ